MSVNGDHVGKTKCLPTYLLLDTSGSMENHEKLLNDTLEHVYSSLVSSPRVSEFAHISIITFNTQPHLVLEMSDIEEVQALPVLSCGGVTNIGLAFEMVKQRITTDVPALQARNKAVLRPAVFLLTDGAPSDKETWHANFASLVDQNWKYRPHVLTFGFGGTTAGLLKRMATKAAFLAKQNTAEKDALSRMLTTLLNTLVASAKTGELVIPQQLPGFDRIPVEFME